MPLISPDRLRKVRAARNWTQRQLADKTKVGQRQIQRIERSMEELVTVHDRTLTKFSEHLRVSADVLAGTEPLSEDLVGSGGKLSEASQRNIRSKLDDVELRLVKLEGAYAVVEFSQSNPIGTIVARDIPNETTGRRLVSYPILKQLLNTAHTILEDPDASYWSEFEILVYEAETELFQAVWRPATNISTAPTPITAAAGHRAEGEAE